MQMPEPDRAVIGRRAAIAADLRRLLPSDAVIDHEDERRVYESDGLTAYRQSPLLTALPSTTAEVAAGASLLPRAGHQGGAQGRRHLAVRRRAAAGGRHPAGPREVQPHPRDRLSESLRRGAAGRHQPGDHPCGARRRLLLRTRSLQPDRLHHRRQCGGEFRRRALPEIRSHRQQCAGAGDGADRWFGRAPRRQASGCRWLRSAGTDDWVRGPARRRHRSHRAHPAQAGDGAGAADRLRQQRVRRRLRRRHHRRRHHSRRHGDDGPAGDPCGRGFRPSRLSSRCRGAADRRARRAGGGGRSSD